MENESGLKSKILIVLKNETPEEQREYQLVESALRERGYEVFITSSGFTAIQEMRENYPLIIAQIDIWGIGGLELLQSAKAIDEESQVLIVTDPENLPETIETLRLGAYDYLLKPVTDVSELLNKVENAEATRNLTLMNKKLIDDIRVSNEQLLKTNRELEKAKQEIEAWNKTLEQRVLERTQELEESKNNIQKMNIELKKANEELLKIDKLKSDFMANISHELRTPLTSIKGFTELLMMYPDTDREQVLEFSSMIYQDTEKLTKLINEVLELSELDSTKINWKSDRIYLPDVASALIESHRPLAEAHNVTIEAKFEDSLPIFQGNHEKIHKALHNLIDNAIKFNKNPGYVAVIIRSLKHEGRTWIRCDVMDHGIGIPEEYHEAVFDRFRQVGDILTDKPQGIGLGLPITKEIIEHHHGHLHLSSQLGKGSNFYFALPVE